MPIPRLDGKRCLDVGSATGFWAFEMEKLGAAEVVSFDLDDKADEDWAAGENGQEWPVGVARHGFEVAKKHLGSDVQRVGGSVYDLSPDLVGEFDFVFVGSLLLHLRDPIGALMAIRTVCHGTLLSFDIVSPALSVVLPHRPVYGMWSSDIQQWWLPNKLGHRHMIEVAGFRVTDHGAGMRQKLGRAYAHKPLRRVRGWRDLTATLSAHFGGPLAVGAGRGVST